VPLISHLSVILLHGLLFSPPTSVMGDHGMWGLLVSPEFGFD